MGIDQRDDQEEWLSPAGDRSQVAQHALLAVPGIAAALHDASVVVGVAAAELADSAILPRVRRVPPVEPVDGDVVRFPGLGIVRFAERLAEVPFPFVGDVVPGRRKHGRHVRQVGWQHALSGGEGCAEGEGVGHAMLCGKEAGEETGATGRAHAATTERSLERQAMFTQSRHTNRLPELRIITRFRRQGTCDGGGR